MALIWFNVGLFGVRPTLISGVSMHPALQASPTFEEYQRQRQAAEHRFVQLGVRQACYLGRRKILFEALMAATVANLTLVAAKTGEMGVSLARQLGRLIAWGPPGGTNGPPAAFSTTDSSSVHPPLAITDSGRDEMTPFRLSF